MKYITSHILYKYNYIYIYYKYIMYYVLYYILMYYVYYNIDFPGGSDGKESTCSAGDPGLIPQLGRSLGEGNGNPLHYSCLENPMDGGGW